MLLVVRSPLKLIRGHFCVLDSFNIHGRNLVHDILLLLKLSLFNLFPNPVLSSWRKSFKLRTLQKTFILNIQNTFSLIQFSFGMDFF